MMNAALANAMQGLKTLLPDRLRMDEPHRRA
jgi:hypothetical protein